jgi:hypothetical protein
MASFGAGHIFDMISRLKQNKALLGKGRIFNGQIAPKTTRRKHIPITHISSEKKAEIARNIRASNNIETMKWIVALLITAILIGSGLYWFVI